MAKIEPPEIRRIEFVDTHGRTVQVEHVGDVIKAIIAELHKGKHRKAVAEAIGMAQQTFNEWCNNPDRFPDYENLSKIIHNVGSKPPRFFALHRPYAQRDAAQLDLNLDAIGAHLQTRANAELLFRILEHLDGKGKVGETLEFWADQYGVRPQPPNVVQIKRSKKNR